MKWFFIIIGIIGVLFLVNAYVPTAWATGFRVPVGEHGFHIPWAVCIIATVLTLGAVKLKSA